MTNPQQFHPGQLLRAITDFTGYILTSPTSCQLHVFRTGDIFLLLDYETTVLINTGELVISEWWLHPFLGHDNNLQVEPVGTP